MNEYILEDVIGIIDEKFKGLDFKRSAELTYISDHLHDIRDMINDYLESNKECYLTPEEYKQETMKEYDNRAPVFVRSVTTAGIKGAWHTMSYADAKTHMAPQMGEDIVIAMKPGTIPPDSYIGNQVVLLKPANEDHIIVRPIHLQKDGIYVTDYDYKTESTDSLGVYRHKADGTEEYLLDFVIYADRKLNEQDSDHPEYKKALHIAVKNAARVAANENTYYTIGTEHGGEKMVNCESIQEIKERVKNQKVENNIER
jgi:hypothetical protein